MEFEAENFPAIKDFYSKTFDWKFTDYGPSYTAFDDGNLEGGFAKGDKRSSGTPLVILYSENLESTLQVIQYNGGSIIKPIYSFPGGRRFHLADPEGNELAVWSEK